MRDELLDYYEYEINHYQEALLNFGRRYPGLAPGLGITPHAVTDPHLTRLVESVALLNARTRLKIDDEFPEITTAFLNTLFPQYLHPIPSIGIAEIGVDRGYPVSGRNTTFPVGTQIVATKDGNELLFSTTAPTSFVPLVVQSVKHQPHSLLSLNNRYATSSLILTLSPAPGTTWSEILKLDSVNGLRFLILSRLGFDFELYEALNRFTETIVIQAAVKTPQGSIQEQIIQIQQPEDLHTPALYERVFPASRRSYSGYGLLMEYFTAPKKFLFFELGRLNLTRLHSQAESVQSIDIHFRLRNCPQFRYEPGADNFKLNCVPVVNLFPAVADPMNLSHKQYKYSINPNRKYKNSEIYQVTEVKSTRTNKLFTPFFVPNRRNSTQCYYLFHRAASPHVTDATTVSLSFVDRHFNPLEAQEDTLMIRTLSTNTGLPSKAQWGYAGELTFANLGSQFKARMVTHPTPRYFPSERRGSTWRFISHLLLNHLSLEERSNSSNLDSFKELLQLYNFRENHDTQKQIDSIQSMSSERSFERLGNTPGTGFVPGITTTLGIRVENFEQHNSFVFMQVIEEFLAHYVHVNTFHKLKCKSVETDELIGDWAPRCGRTMIL